MRPQIPPTVWIVDDSPLEAEQAKRVLATRYRVEVFHDGEALLDRLASTEPPDVLMLDWNLPGVSGIETCQLLRANLDELALPILMMTGTMETGSTSVTGLSAGANDFLRKPLEATELLARVGTLVRIRQLHRNLETSKHALQQRIDFEQQLVGIVSHDLRNPLGIISMAVAVLQKRSSGDERQMSGLKRINAATDRANRMIGDLLDFTQARLGGRIPIEPRPVDLHALTRQVVEETMSVETGRQFEVRTEGDGVCEVDEDRMAQVVGNLLTNAVKYGATEEPIQITARASAQAFELSVRNGGTPIPRDLFPRLFEPMQRGPASANANYRSIGLGLFIVREIIRAHGGRVDVRSTEQEGTLFTVCVPRKNHRSPPP